MYIKFMYSKKATKIDEIFTVNLTVCSNRQINGEDFVNFCGLLGKHELYVQVLFLFIFTKSFCNFSSVPTVFGNQQTEYVNIIKEMLMASLTYQASYDVRFCAVKGKEKYNFLIIFIVFI